MGQKDLSQKNLESYPDVFADTVNALLYDGEQILQAKNLQPAPTESLYPKQSGGLKNQFHDVSQYEMLNGRVNVQYTLENETRSSSKMILRKAGYQGAIYREQYEKRREEIYPVISLVLYWGSGKWKAAKNLHNMFKRETLPRKIMQYIDSIQLHVYDMRCLKKEIRERFTSDMRMVVDYLAERDAYKPTTQPILHIEAFLLLMREVSGDSRYERMIEDLDEQEKGDITMCGLLDRYEAQGIERGMEKGMKKGMEKGMEKGESLFAKLMECLFADNRMEEARLVLKDTEMRKRLYHEYGIC